MYCGMMALVEAKICLNVPSPLEPAPGAAQPKTKCAAHSTAKSMRLRVVKVKLRPPTEAAKRVTPA
jgi:hypothetical protein